VAISLLSVYVLESYQQAQQPHTSCHFDERRVEKSFENISRIRSLAINIHAVIIFIVYITLTPHRLRKHETSSTPHFHARIFLCYDMLVLLESLAPK